MLEREKELLKDINDKNIVRLEAHIVDKFYHYFIFELCKGGDLQSLLKDHEHLPIEVIRHYAMEMVHALEILQLKHIVHRDIKPANILLDNTFHVILADFGLAKWIDEEDVYEVLKKKEFNKPWNGEFDEDSGSSCNDDSDSDSDSDSSSNTESKFEKKNIVKASTFTDQILSWFSRGDAKQDESTSSCPSSEHSEEDDDEESESDINDRLSRAQTKCGTLLYKSPEMIRYNIACPASDIWALGIILYQCLTGKHPFNLTGSNDKYKVEKQICNDEVDFTFVRAKETKMDIIDLIKKLLTKDPLKRLGGGIVGSDYDIEHLKMHSFFSKLNFNELHRRIPQVQKCPKGYNMIKFCRRYDKLEFSEFSTKNISNRKGNDSDSESTN